MSECWCCGNQHDHERGCWYAGSVMREHCGDSPFNTIAALQAKLDAAAARETELCSRLTGFREGVRLSSDWNRRELTTLRRYIEALGEGSEPS